MVLLYLGGYIDLRFGDESAFSLDPNIPYGWMPKGVQKGIPARKNGKLNLFSLLNLGGQLTSYQTKQNVNSSWMISWIDDFVASIKKETVILLDNASWHRSAEFTEKIEDWKQKGLHIFFLPTYSPELNIVEILWKKMKYEWLKPKDYLNEELFHEAINHILKNYDTGEYIIDFNIHKRY